MSLMDAWYIYTVVFSFESPFITVLYVMKQLLNFCAKEMHTEYRDLTIS